MTVSSRLFLLPLSFTVASCHLLPPDRTTGELIARGGIEERVGRTRLQDRQPRSVSTLKVLDFSADIDQLPDSNGEYTGATLEAGPLPESFTICSALMVEAWTTAFSSATMWMLPGNDGNVWGWFTPHAAASNTEYVVRLGPLSFIKAIETVFFPLQWTHTCLSLDQGGG